MAFNPTNSRATAETVADFCRRNDLNRAPITDMPGIGGAGEEALSEHGISQVTQIFGQFLLLDNGARDCQEVCDAMMEVSLVFVVVLLFSFLFGVRIKQCLQCNCSFFLHLLLTFFFYFFPRFSLFTFFLFPLKTFLYRPPSSPSQWLKEHGVGKSQGHTVVFACANYLHEKQLFTYEMD